MDAHDVRDEQVTRLAARCAWLELERAELLERIDELEKR